MVRVPTIAELEKMVEEAKANPRKKAKKRGGNRRNHSARTNYAAQVCARGVAMAELVQRVNENPATGHVVDAEAIPYLSNGHYTEADDWEQLPAWSNERLDWRVLP